MPFTTLVTYFPSIVNFNFALPVTPPLTAPTSADSHVPREVIHTTLNELATASERIETGQPLSAALDAALLRGTSIGGARPKALIDDGDRKLIAKFSSTTDTYPVVQGEFAAMELARRRLRGAA